MLHPWNGIFSWPLHMQPWTGVLTIDIMPRKKKTLLFFFLLFFQILLVKLDAIFSTHRGYIYAQSCADDLRWACTKKWCWQAKMRWEIINSRIFVSNILTLAFVEVGEIEETRWSWAVQPFYASLCSCFEWRMHWIETQNPLSCKRLHPLLSTGFRGWLMTDWLPFVLSNSCLVISGT